MAFFNLKTPPFNLPALRQVGSLNLHAPDEPADEDTYVCLETLSIII